MSVNSQGKMEILKNHAALEGRWGNVALENIPMGPPSGPVNYKAKTYLPNASEWATRQRTLEEQASSERSRSPMTLSNSNLENIERNRRSYNRYRERMGLSSRRNRTPSRERRRKKPSQSPRRRYGVGRRYSVRRRPSPRRSARHSPRRTVNEFGRNITYNYRPRGYTVRNRRKVSPLRYTTGPEGQAVDEFGRNIPRNYRSRKPSRSISPLRYTVAPNGKTVDEFGRNVSRRRKF